MPPTGSSFTALNLPSTFSLPQCMEYFTLTAGPNTDLWRKPPNGDTSTAPIVFTSLRNAFVVAEVTVSADWEMEWDQGGLVIFAGAAPQSFSSDSPAFASPTRSGRYDYGRLSESRPCKWVKAGMEFSSGTLNASSVSATADGADWCQSPLCLPNTGSTTTVQSLRIKLERVGYSLWIWYQVPSASPYARTPGAVSSTWRKLREVTWFFYGVEDKFVHVGVYASRPTSISREGTMWEMMNGRTLSSSATSDTGDGLMVEFEDLEIF
ncbi:hypothetical protein ASPWEDRAFT_182487 [Aspergillus wentii DTO 134E9]|uniref:Uncharacterized protein n=1 Tax=Aspergillus wentii DTO 134E9 TaxID=1073089 RepID=A0A1L9RRY9_ASPWE|nr:uncharacterized protein ASPWEDRAFT_182487 [Aspergillus wentii DTO 134E9]KAI9930474.1 hypothetical protein MW887_011228 [Aspergillus wentii]OJJ37633.1 hypothetical protein ASPWEDRAFT_182487 [Aspergillus wentii DTO 134E9]